MFIYFSICHFESSPSEICPSVHLWFLFFLVGKLDRGVGGGGGVAVVARLPGLLLTLAANNITIIMVLETLQLSSFFFFFFTLSVYGEQVMERLISLNFSL